MIDRLHRIVGSVRYLSRVDNQHLGEKWLWKSSSTPSLALIGGRLRLGYRLPLPQKSHLSREALWKGTQSLGGDTDLPLPSPRRLLDTRSLSSITCTRRRPTFGHSKKSSALWALCLNPLCGSAGCSGFFGVPLCRFPILIENERIDFLETHGLK